MKVKNLVRQPRLLLLAGANCLVLGMLTHQVLKPVVLPLPRDAQYSPISLAPLPPVPSAIETADPEKLYSALVTQPLFHQDRHLVPEKPADAITVTPPPAYILTGYLGLPGRPGRAFLQPTSGGKTLAVGQGDVVDGWTVAGVSARTVELRQGERAVAISKGGGAELQGMRPVESSPTKSPAPEAGVTTAISSPSPKAESAPGPAMPSATTAPIAASPSRNFPHPSLITQPAYPLPTASGNAAGGRAPAPVQGTESAAPNLDTAPNVSPAPPTH